MKTKTERRTLQRESEYKETQILENEKSLQEEEADSHYEYMCDAGSCFECGL